jgi:uncharacterized lipoprotein
MTLRPYHAVFALAAILIAGCATNPKQESQKKDDDEYVMLPPRTGSNVPRKVKKSDILAGKVIDAGDAVDIDKDKFAREAQRGGVKTDSGPR